MHVACGWIRAVIWCYRLLCASTVLSILPILTNLVHTTTLEEFEIICLLLSRSWDSDTKSLWAPQGYEQLSQDSKFILSDSKVYIFQNIPISTGEKWGAVRCIWGIRAQMHTPQVALTLLVKNGWWFTSRMHFILPVLGIIESSESFLSITQAVVCGRKLRPWAAKKALRVEILETLICPHSTLRDGITQFDKRLFRFSPITEGN